MSIIFHQIWIDEEMLNHTHTHIYINIYSSAKSRVKIEIHVRVIVIKQKTIIHKYMCHIAYICTTISMKLNVLAFFIIVAFCVVHITSIYIYISYLAEYIRISLYLSISLSLSLSHTHTHTHTHTHSLSLSLTLSLPLSLSLYIYIYIWAPWRRNITVATRAMQSSSNELNTPASDITKWKQTKFDKCE